MKLEQVCRAMTEIAPLRLAEEWDNVGLLLGDRSADVRRVMTCLTITPGVVEEAVRAGVDVLISHHPLPFKPVSKITSDTVAGKMLWQLCRGGVAVYSAHTAFDSATGGINDQWATGLGLTGIRPMLPDPEQPDVGSGRLGELPELVTANHLKEVAAKFAGASRPRIVGDFERKLKRIAIGCGSGGSFVSAANRLGCDALITGEATFHTCLEAENTGLTLVLVGHYASEQFAMVGLAKQLADALPELAAAEDGWVRASEADRDVIAVDPVSLNP